MPFALTAYSALGVSALLKDAAAMPGMSSPIYPMANSIRAFVEQAPQACDFHRSIPGYQVTPLVSLPNLARHLHLNAVLVKDESQRFRLNAFKALGATYAMARLIAAELKYENPPSLEALTIPEMRSQISSMTFTTATEGNHGRGVAWSAALLGAKAVIFMPRATAPERIRAIEGEGAEVLLTEVNYDETVRIAQAAARQNGWHLVQDTAAEGYRRVPAWIAAGYLTMAEEIQAQLEAVGKQPTHVLLQAGVGTLAGALTTWFAAQGSRMPWIGLMEPAEAACYFTSMQANDDRPHAVGGELRSVMAGLNCGVPNPDMYPVLRDYCGGFFSCPDYVAARGMRLAVTPFGDDPCFVSGASGAVGLGLISLLGTHPEYATMRRALGLNSDSVILLISTEGDTDAKSYYQVIHDGAYATPDSVRAVPKGG